MSGNARATRAGVVNGLLVFVVPMGLLVYGYAAGDVPPAYGPKGLGHFLSWNAKSVVILALLGVASGWRTRVHGVRYAAGESSGWEGVAEAAACGVLTAASYTLPPLLVTRAMDLRPLVFYCGTGVVIGGLLGVVLRALALGIVDGVSVDGPSRS